MNPHGCYNRAEFEPHVRVQDGWTADGRRYMITVPFRMSMQCEYDLRQQDAGCQGCRHQY